MRFWDSVSGLCIRTLNAQLGEVTSVDMKDVYLLTSSRDNAIRIWDVRMVRFLSLPFVPDVLTTGHSSARFTGTRRIPTRRRTLFAPRLRTRPCSYRDPRMGCSTCGTGRAARCSRRSRGTKASCVLLGSLETRWLMAYPFAQVYGAAWNDQQSLLASYGSDSMIRTWEFDEEKAFEGEEV